MPNGAILAHERFILKHHAALGTVIFHNIGRACEVQNLVAFNRRRTRIHRKRADPCEIIKIDTNDCSRFGNPHLSFHNMIAGVDVCNETLESIGDEFYWAFEQFGGCGCCDFIAICVDLYPERAANVIGNNMYVFFGQVEVFGENHLHHVRCLARVIDGQLVF